MFQGRGMSEGFFRFLGVGLLRCRKITLFFGGFKMNACRKMKSYGR